MNRRDFIKGLAGMAVVFGGANAYLGLRVGLTVFASIPAAVISMGIIRVLMKRDSVLENNMVQTIFIGGLLRDYFDRREDKAAADNGILFASGLIAGEGLVGILLALVAIIKVGGRPLAEVIDLGAPLGDIGGVLGLLLICVCMMLAARSGKRS